jgi:hypothetical protein
MLSKNLAARIVVSGDLKYDELKQTLSTMRAELEPELLKMDQVHFRRHLLCYYKMLGS